MNRVPIVLPELGTGEATFSLWHVAIGDRVALGERLAEVLIPGIAVELQAEAAGVLMETFARPGERVIPHATLAILEVEKLSTVD